MAYIHHIYDFDLENDFGTGPVVSVFWNFCSFHCKGCWNQNTWDRQENLFISNQELIEKINQSLNSDFPKDLAVLGGDPLVPQNRTDFLEVIKGIKTNRPNIKIGVWTGYTYETLIKEPNIQSVLSYIDILIDGPFIERLKVKNKRYGSSNQRVIDVQKSLKQNQLILEKQYLNERTTTA